MAGKCAEGRVGDANQLPSGSAQSTAARFLRLGASAQSDGPADGGEHGRRHHRDAGNVRQERAPGSAAPIGTVADRPNGVPCIQRPAIHSPQLVGFVQPPRRNTGSALADPPARGTRMAQCGMAVTPPSPSTRTAIHLLLKAGLFGAHDVRLRTSGRIDVNESGERGHRPSATPPSTTGCWRDGRTIPERRAQPPGVQCCERAGTGPAANMGVATSGTTRRSPGR